MSGVEYNWLIQLIIDIFSIILGVIGVVTAPIISLFGIIICISVIAVEINSGNISNPLIMSISIASFAICALCFAVAWSKRS